MSLGLTVGALTMIFLSTAAGAAAVFFTGRRGAGKNASAAFNGFASGIMVAASVWSLIMPATEQSESDGWGSISFLPAAVGIAAGGALIVLTDAAALRLSGGSGGMTTHGKMLAAMTVHNIPEGLAVGLALGVALPSGDAAASGAFRFALGIAIQNFPEGAAVSLSLRGAGQSAKKSFFCGCASGAVEPLFAGAGLLLAAFFRPLQPWLLGLSAGAMLFVVAEDLIPAASRGARPFIGAAGFLAGFILMMSLDCAL